MKPMFTTIKQTPSFPPIDDLISKLSEIDYHKHTRNFINVCIILAAYVAAIVSIICTRVAQWYQQGGKDDLRKAYINGKDFAVDCYIWVACEGYPQVVKFAQDVKQTYRAWSDLVKV
jgi:hypothetical protein